MAKQPAIQTSFLSGLISPEMFGRLDSPVRANGAGIMENMIPLPSGGATRAPGSLMIANQGAKSSGEIGINDDRLIFHYRWYAAGQASRDFVFIWGKESATQKLRAYERLSSADYGSDLWVNPASTTTYLTHRLDYAGSTSTAITIEPINWGVAPGRGSYLVTWDSVEGFPAIFTTQLSVSGGSAGISKIWFDGSTFFCQEVINPATDGDNIDAATWQLITTYQGRLIVAGRLTATGVEGDGIRVIGSAVDDYSNWDVGADDADAFDFILASDYSTRVMWLLDQEMLLLGCDGSEFVVHSAHGGAVTPGSVISREVTTIGCPVAGGAALAGDRVVFVSNGGGVVEWFFSAGFQAYQGVPLTDHVRHIFSGPVSSIHLQAQTVFNVPILWVSMGDGRLYGMVYNRRGGHGSWFEITEYNKVYQSYRLVDSFVDLRGQPRTVFTCTRGWNAGAQTGFFFDTICFEEFLWPERTYEYGAEDAAPVPHSLSPVSQPFVRSCHFLSRHKNVNKVLDIYNDGTNTRVVLAHRADPSTTTLGSAKFRFLGHTRYGDINGGTGYWTFSSSEGNELYGASHSGALDIDDLTEVDPDGDLGWLIEVFPLSTLAAAWASDAYKKPLVQDAYAGPTDRAYALWVDGHIVEGYGGLEWNDTSDLLQFSGDSDWFTTIGATIYGGTVAFGFPYDSIVETPPAPVDFGSRRRCVDADIWVHETGYLEAGPSKYHTTQATLELVPQVSYPPFASRMVRHPIIGDYTNWAKVCVKTRKGEPMTILAVSADIEASRM